MIDVENEKRIDTLEYRVFWLHVFMLCSALSWVLIVFMVACGGNAPPPTEGDGTETSFVLDAQAIPLLGGRLIEEQERNEESP